MIIKPKPGSWEKHFRHPCGYFQEWGLFGCEDPCPRCGESGDHVYQDVWVTVIRRRVWVPAVKWWKWGKWVWEEK